MLQRRLRLGVRAQLTLIVLLGAVLSTAATLFIADNAIRNYALQQARNQEQDNMKIARLVLTTSYGQNVSISADNKLVADSPTAGRDFGGSNDPSYGKYPLNDDTEFVDGVKNLIGGAVSVFKCADARGNFEPCTRISTTLPKSGKGTSEARDTGQPLGVDVARQMNLSQPGNEREWLGVETIDGVQYYADYAPLLNPQGELIGVIAVGVPLDVVTAFEQRTTIELLLIGVIIMIAGVILALLFASAIVNTLQRAARQVSVASERIGGIAAQQSGGAAQQVWAVNAINKALQGFSETARDIAQRTDQLALMGNQVIQRRSEIAPAQIDSILAYMTRSVRDISSASRQQAAQYDRMTGAMQAVIEIAEQVAGNSQQSAESAERLDLVVRQLQQLVGVRRFPVRTTTQEGAAEEFPMMPPASPRTAARVTTANMGAGMAGGMSGGLNGGMYGGTNAGYGARPQMPQMGEMGAGYGNMAPAGQMPPQYGLPAPGGRNSWNTRGARGGMSGGLGNGRGYGDGGPGGAPDWQMPPLPEMPPMMPMAPMGQRGMQNGGRRAPNSANRPSNRSRYDQGHDQGYDQEYDPYGNSYRPGDGSDRR